MSAARVVLLFCAALACVDPVFASDKRREPPAVVYDPPKEAVPLPKPDTPPPVAKTYFPDLPPSHTCTQATLQGLWELQRVYEAPPGAETDAYNANPVQYVHFSKDSLLYRYNSGRQRLQPKVALDSMKRHAGALLQYLLQDAGMLYFYQNGVSNETSVCFIVAETRPPFPAGNLLLMPPKGQITGRLVKEYKKVWSPPDKSAASPKRSPPKRPPPKNKRPQRHRVHHNR